MKTTKIFLIAALLAIAAMSYAQPEPVKTPYTVNITLVRALHNPGLAAAMHQQLNVSLLTSHAGQMPDIFYGYVIYKYRRYCISGTYEEWKAFFSVSYENRRPVS